MVQLKIVACAWALQPSQHEPCLKSWRNGRRMWKQLSQFLARQFLYFL